jgi:hypothetical protein
VSGLDILIEDLAVTGEFAQDCNSILNGTLSGIIDVRILAPVLVDLVPSGDPDEICGLLAGFGATCGACADGTNYCLAVEVTDIPAALTDDLTCG